jgi:DNA-binding winged helix-turn-helix (wHTH) protein
VGVAANGVAHKNGWLPPVLFLFAACFAASCHAVYADEYSEKVNLALRRTAHHLLKSTGDRHSPIALVEHPAPHVWRIQMKRTFAYDSLPALLQSSFETYGLSAPYEVAIIDCIDLSILLGYHFADLKQSGGVPCAERSAPPDCSYIQVTFAVAPAPNSPFSPLWLWVGWGVAGLLALLFFFRKGRKRVSSTITEQPESESVSRTMAFGQSRLDVENQTLFCGAVRHSLTYRETKLLHLFVQHPNAVLERGFILQHVWADEGILVTRSVDMFVSRLRKLLRDDPTIQLSAVHGVGYRLEVQGN